MTSIKVNTQIEEHAYRLQLAEAALVVYLSFAHARKSSFSVQQN